MLNKNYILGKTEIRNLFVLEVSVLEVSLSARQEFNPWDIGKHVLSKWTGFSVKLD